jgi:hypothetical protein
VSLHLLAQHLGAKPNAKTPHGVLNAKQKARYATVESGGEGKFPIPDKGHARAALARIDQAKPPLTPAQKAKVRAKADSMLGGSK